MQVRRHMWYTPTLPCFKATFSTPVTGSLDKAKGWAQINDMIHHYYGKSVQGFSLNKEPNEGYVGLSCKTKNTRAFT